MKTLKNLILACACVVAPVAALATSIDLALAGYERTGTEFDFTADVVSVFGSSLIVSEAASGSGLGGDVSDVTRYALNVGTQSSSDFLIAVNPLNLGGTANPLEVLFPSASAGGVFASADGAAVLFSLNDPTLSLSSGYLGSGIFTVTVLRELAPIPLPAGGVLLFTGAGALVLLRRRCVRSCVPLCGA